MLQACLLPSARPDDTGRYAHRVCTSARQHGGDAMTDDPKGPMLSTSSAPRPRRIRKRPRVPEEQRRRATVACSSCRRLKEKCDGSIPCERCRRFARPCQPAGRSPIATAESERRNEHRHDSERIRNLELVVRHFLGQVPLDNDRLKRVVQTLELDEGLSGVAEDADVPVLDEEQFTVKPLSRSTTYYSGEFSHWNFSRRVRKQVDQRLRGAGSIDVQEQFRVLDHWRASHLALQSRDASVRRAQANFPPRQVASFLTEIYFQFAQTNSFFVEEGWVHARLEQLYSRGIELTTEDAPWICTMLGMLAVATQFAHLAGGTTLHPDGSSGLDDSAFDSVGVSFYHMAAELTPIVITVASTESVQAFLTLAHFALPLDTQGLAYSYLGLALTMAVQNGMHRKLGSNGLDEATADLRNRLWWTTYKLEKRVSILHGRPRSIACIDIDADYPPDNPPDSSQASDERKWENTMTKLTDWLGDIAFAIQMLRRSPPRLRQVYFARLFEIKNQYIQWWQAAAIPSAMLSHSRAIVHLHLSHHLNLVFLGRTFMFSQSEKASESAKATQDAGNAARISLSTKQVTLVNDAVASAEEIVALCRFLKVNIGLAKSSYVEFTSCRAAVLVLLAQSLQKSSPDLRNRLAEGVELIQHMSSANESTQSDASVVAAIEAAIRVLDSQDETQPQGVNAVRVQETGENAFDAFKNWASGFQHRGVSTGGQSSTEFDDLPSSVVYDAFADFGWNPFDASILDDGTTDSGPFDTSHNYEPFNIAFSDTLADVQPTVPRRE